MSSSGSPDPGVSLSLVRRKSLYLEIPVTWGEAGWLTLRQAACRLGNVGFEAQIGALLPNQKQSWFYLLVSHSLRAPRSSNDLGITDLDLAIG